MLKIIIIKKHILCFQKGLQHYHVESNLKHFTQEKSENMSNTCNTNVTQKKGLEEAINCVQKKKEEVINNSKEYIDT
jgi:hypothetical protein